MTDPLYLRGLLVSVKPTGKKNILCYKNIFIKFVGVITQRKHHKISTSPPIPTCLCCFWYLQLALSSVDTLIMF